MHEAESEKLKCFVRADAAQSWRVRGFTTIELIGVMTILAFLAAAIIPTLIRRIDAAAWNTEKGELQTMADGYASYILHNKSLTNSAGMARAIAQEIALPVSAVNTTPRHWNRVFLVD